MNGRQLHRTSTYIGCALLVQALSGDGGVISPRLLLGLLFIAAGVARAYFEKRRSGSS
jgi:hypothetical protein